MPTVLNIPGPTTATSTPMVSAQTNPVTTGVEQPILHITNLTKSVDTPNGPLNIINNINLAVRSGEYIMVYGRSGSGKTTLINAIAGLDRPSGGSIIVGGRDIAKMNDKELSHYRMAALGIVYQDTNILDSLNVIKNVELPMTLANMPEERRRPQALKMLEVFHLSHLASKMSSEISKGEKFRVSLARALVNSPLILLIDSMTDYLDSKTADDVMENIRFINEQSGLTIILATNNPNFVHYPHRVIYLSDGQVSRVVENRPLRRSW
ncbi:ABC transporter ATP-binding protein [Patescibacteria group bacterium]|nr:ABC transporter ATP-binding protein [Patescibacteria group bacterium]